MFTIKEQSVIYLQYRIICMDIIMPSVLSGIKAAAGILLRR